MVAFGSRASRHLGELERWKTSTCGAARPPIQSARSKTSASGGSSTTDPKAERELLLAKAPVRYEKRQIQRPIQRAGLEAHPTPAEQPGFHHLWWRVAPWPRQKVKGPPLTLWPRE